MNPYIILMNVRSKSYTILAPATVAPVLNANVKRNPNPNPDPNLKPYPTPNH